MDGSVLCAALVRDPRVWAHYLDQARPQDAERTLDQILSDHPDDKEARASHAALLAAKGSPEHLDRAIAAYKSLVDKDPDNRDYRYQLAGAYHLKGDDEAARTQYLSILAVNRTDGAALYALARIHVRRQRFEEAMRYAGQVVTRTMLLENVWDYHFDPQTNVIDVHISRLRSKIDKGFERPLLHTIRGAGYMIRDGLR
jgi:hypothetical protein